LPKVAISLASSLYSTLRSRQIRNSNGEDSVSLAATIDYPVAVKREVFLPIAFHIFRNYLAYEGADGTSRGHRD